MRQNLFRTCSAKLQSRKAETLAELLVSVLVIVLALTMFATALMAARKMLAKGDQIINEYYASRNALELEGSTDAGSADTDSTDTDPADTASTAHKTDADLVFSVKNGTENKVTGFSHRTGAANVGEYPVTLYSSQETDDAADGAQKAAGYYRYSRKK